MNDSRSNHQKYLSPLLFRNSMGKAACLLPAFLSSALFASNTGPDGVWELDALVVSPLISGIINVDDVPSSMSIVEDTLITELGALTVDQVLEEIPGLQVDVESGRISRPSIRGTNASQSLVLIDGRRFAAGFQRMSDINQLLVGGIESIEVIRGPVSSVYGSEAIGGVVNIITKKAPVSEQDLTATTQLGWGRYEEYSGGITGGMKSDRFSAYGSFGAKHNHEYESGDGAPTDVDDIDLYGGFFNLGYEIASSTKLSSGLTFSDSERVGMRPSSGGALRTAKDERFGGYIQLDQDIRENLDAVIRAYTEKYDCDISMAGSKSTSYSEMTNKIYVLDGHLSADLSDSLNTTVGGEIRREMYDDLSDSTEEDRMDNEATYGQFIWSPTDSSNIMGGLRFDHYNDFGDHVSPQLSALYHLAPGWRVHAGWGQGFRAPNSMELSIESYQNAGRITVLPNPDLDPESSNTYEVGIHYRNEVLFLGLTAYHTEITDMIEAVSIDSSTKIRSNLSSVSIDGLELEGKYALNPYLSVDGFLTWINPVNDDTHFHVEGKQRWNSRIALVAGIPEWDIKGRFSVYFGSDEWGVSDSMTDIDPIVDIRLEKKVGSRWNGYLGVRNLTDEGYHPVLYYTGVNLQY